MKTKLKNLIEKIKEKLGGDSTISSVSINLLRLGIKMMKMYFGSFKTTTKILILSIAVISLVIMLILFYRTDVEIIGINPINKTPYIITSIVIFLIGSCNIYLIMKQTKANKIIMAITTYLNVKICYGTFFAFKNWNVNLTELYNCKGIIVINKYYKIGEKIDYLKKLISNIDDKIEDLKIDYLMPDLTLKKMEDMQPIAIHIVNLIKKEQKMLELIDLIIKEQESLVITNNINYKAWIIGGIAVVILIGICIVVIKKYNIPENTGDDVKETINDDVIAETTTSDIVIDAVETTTTVLTKKKKMYTTMITDPKPEIEGNGGYSPSDFVVVEAKGDVTFLNKIKNLMLGNTKDTPNENQVALKDEFNMETGVISTIITKTPQTHIEHWNSIGINPWRYFEKTRIFKFWQTPEVQEVKKVVKNTIEEV